ncbi:hypothetical protein CGLAU_02425 [Corynebacterium glaucum]|uniref:DUF1963 domain-containing protein n=1 Tax=Corynebacterium glaucum TaxID=187491 RepID=A0A1Q2HUJ8_9CORY|nr:DUF1963 domain-containing protein [Corynebacterium glaucum]AQQ14470.1 hypothetical protein CGLAU_02425 [Corynebacterium glaucum]
MIERTSCCVFSERGYSSTSEEMLRELLSKGEAVSWLGGPGIAGIEWPRNADGAPLAHVASFNLSDAQCATDLPGGYLELYSDLTTYGDDAADAAQNGWLVRWVDKRPDELTLTNPETPPEAVPQPVLQLGRLYPGFTLPYFEDLGELSETRFNELQEATTELNVSWHRHRFGREMHDEVGFTTVGEADSQHGYEPYRYYLDECLPLNADDAHVLVAAVESWTALNGWFGDAGSFEVWMRRSDLQARIFDAAWCCIRTD